MKIITRIFFFNLLLIILLQKTSNAERLAILNWETKAPESLDSLSLSKIKGREEGIAIIELDKNSKDYGKILSNIPVDPSLVLHHIFYNQDLTKAYITALEGNNLYYINLKDKVWRLREIPVPMCKVQENIIFSNNNKKWWLTCMGSSNIIEGNAENDTIVKVIHIPNSYPHGITLNEDIDRLLVANCVAPDMSSAGKTIEVIEASTGKHLESIIISRGTLNAPVEVVFIPKTTPPIAYATTMMENSLWALKWDNNLKSFITKEVFDFRKNDKSLMPLEIYYNNNTTRAYITSADPGGIHIFDISKDKMNPTLIKSLKTAGGSHHVAISKNENFAYVQNGLLNIPGINDGSISVIDLDKLEVIDSIDTFKKDGKVPNSITLLPEWYNPAGHINNGLLD